MNAESTAYRDTEARSGQSVDVVVPVFNEMEMLPRFLERLAGLDLPLNLIFIDNGSTDGTLAFLTARPDISLITHETNLGYGRSLADGLAASTAGRVIIIDADCEYPPEAIPALLRALDASPVVYASRFLAGGAIDMSRFRLWGNRLLSILFNLLYGQHITDLYTGMKGLRREAFAGITFTRTSFDFVVELAAKLSRRGLRFSEVPVTYSPRRTGRSKMSHLPEFIKAKYCLLYYRVSRNG
ncbi:MAG: glycosyltransferase family 2 protein [Thermoleophilia bacterium]